MAIGVGSGFNTQGTGSVAIGFQAGYGTQGRDCIAIGYQAGYNVQGEGCISIGSKSKITQVSSSANSIVIDASGGTITQTATTKACYIAPVRKVTTVPAGFFLTYYNPATGEFVVGP